MANTDQSATIERLEEEVDAFRSSEAYRRLERLCDEKSATLAELRSQIKAMQETQSGEMADLRATAELIERAGAAMNHADFAGIVFDHDTTAIPGYCQFGLLWHEAETDWYDTLLEALQALAGKK